MPGLDASGGPIGEIRAAFQLAALTGEWRPALSRLADAAGGVGAQLIGVGPLGAVPFNIVHNVDPDALERFAAMDGGDPTRNARVRAGMNARPLEVLTEADFDDPQAALRSELYADLLFRYDIPFNIQTTLMQGASGVVGLAVLHGAAHGVGTAQERAVVEAVAADVQAAVALQLTLENRSAEALMAGLETADLAAIVCDSRGRVSASTPPAEALLSQQGWLRLGAGALGAARPADEKALLQAIWCASLRPPLTARASQVALRDAEGAVLVIEVAPLPPSGFALGLDHSVLLIARLPRDIARTAPVLRARFGLTESEVQVCIAVARGAAPAEIAASRGVATETIRAQLKRANAKLGVNRQAELAALLHRL